MPSSVDEQPPSRPPRPRPGPPPRRRPPARARGAAPRQAPARRGVEQATRRGAQAAPPRRRPPARTEVDGDERGRRRGRSQTNVVLLLSLLTVVVISLAGFGIALSGRSSNSGPPPAPDDTPVPVTSFRDPDTGASLDYPRTWKRVQVPNATYRLVLDGGNNVGMTLRVFPTEVATTATNLENVKAVTDGIVGSNASVQILKQQAVTLNGMVGYYYFYTFTDDSGLPAVHAHYFLFQGKKMNMIVFQSLPEDFEKLASTFDRIAESFRSDPAVTIAAAPATTTTTAAG